MTAGQPKLSTSPLLVSAFYAIASLAWIVFSDAFVRYVTESADVMTRWSVVKGSAFVLSSAALIYFLMRRISTANQVLSTLVDVRTSELQQSEGRFRRLLETAQEGVWVLDRSNRTEFVNQSMAGMLGYSQEEMIGRTPEEYVDCEWQALWGTSWREPQSLSNAELRFRRRDGSGIWVSMSRAPLFDERGRHDGDIMLITDITEKRLSEDAQRLQATALNAAANGIVITDTNGTILWVNPAFTAMTGYGPQEVLGQNPRILRSGNHGSSFYRDLWNTIREGRVWSGEMVNRHKDGHLYFEQMTIAPVRSRDETITHFVAIKQDVTARKQAEEALRSNEERFRHLVENISDGILAVDAEGTILFASESACNVSGYSRPQIVGKSLFQFADVADQADMRTQFERVLSVAGSTLQWGARVRHGDGSWRYFEGSTANRFNIPGVNALIINFRDNTVGKQMKEALVEAEAKYRAIYENAIVGIYLSSPEGRYLSMNQTLASVYGFSSPEDVIQHCANIKALYVDGDRWEQLRRALMSDGVVQDFEYEVQRSDGTRRSLIESARAVYGGGGRLLYYEGVVRDITDRKTLEVQLRQAQKLEAVGRLAGGVAHDFNNMLGVILGYGDILQSQLPIDHPGLNSAAEIQKAARKAADLTRQLLAFSRKQILQPQVVNLNSLIDELNKMLRRLIGDDIELVFRPGTSLADVKADPGQLEQVLMNLAVNSKDAMPGGGRLLVETSNTVVDHAFAAQHAPMRPGNYVVLSITDNGLGMNADTLSHIFEPFFTTKEQGKGTGLGLSIVYGIVKQSGGYIWVDSHVNQGTTFRIYLPPTQDSEIVRRTLQTRAAAAGGSETILVVEDDEVLRGMMRIVLTRAGYRILDVQNGREALSLLAGSREPIHLAMTDIIMPGGVSGWQLAQWIDTERPTIRTVFMTGFGLETEAFGMELPTDVMLLMKPFGADELLRQVRKALDGRSGLRSAATSH